MLMLQDLTTLGDRYAGRAKLRGVGPQLVPPLAREPVQVSPATEVSAQRNAACGARGPRNRGADRTHAGRANAVASKVP